VLDAYFDCEMTQLLENLPLSSEIRLALIEKQGPLGEILTNVMAYERGEWNKLEKSCFESQVLRDGYFQSAQWANDVMNTIVMGKAM
jgi:EAL and modified HD-GYP domain-containing signal transduction protein